MIPVYISDRLTISLPLASCPICRRLTLVHPDDLSPWDPALGARPVLLTALGAHDDGDQSFGPQLGGPHRCPLRPASAGRLGAMARQLGAVEGPDRAELLDLALFGLADGDFGRLSRLALAPRKESPPCR